MKFANEHCKNAIPYIEYRIKETTIRNLFLKNYDKKEWKKIKKEISDFRIFLLKNFNLLIAGKLEPKDKKRTISLLIFIVSPKLYSYIYNKYRINKNEKKL